MNPQTLDWDTPLTDEDLRSLDAVEAAFLSPSPSSSSRSRTTDKKPNSYPRTARGNHLKQLSASRRRQLPTSVLALCNPISLSPAQDDVRIRYPEMKFGGQIVYSRTALEVEKSAQELLRSLQAKKAEVDQVSIGFDIEWKPTFKKGVIPRKAAVMQICGDTTRCYVMHIFHSGITKSLRFLLEDSTLLKVGAGIGGDCRKVSKDYNVSVNTFEDLSRLANQKLGKNQIWGLKSLCEILIGKELLKPNKVRLGNWEVDTLSENQLKYAATDAFASWHLYKVLKSLPNRDPEDSEQTNVEARELLASKTQD